MGLMVLSVLARRRLSVIGSWGRVESRHPLARGPQADGVVPLVQAGCEVRISDRVRDGGDPGGCWNHFSEPMRLAIAMEARHSRGCFFSNSCAVPNVYQSVLVSFGLDLGTPDGRKITVNLPLLSARKNEAKNALENGGPKRLLNRGKPSKIGVSRAMAGNGSPGKSPKIVTRKTLINKHLKIQNKAGVHLRFVMGT
jgi:hypothetical protein